MPRSRAQAHDDAERLADWFETEGPDPANAQRGAPLRKIVNAAQDVELARDKLDAAVAAARRDEYSWGAIGAVLGVSRQAARERFGHVESRIESR
jgi:hypothetical protein